MRILSFLLTPTIPPRTDKPNKIINLYSVKIEIEKKLEESPERIIIMKSISPTIPPVTSPDFL